MKLAHRPAGFRSFAGALADMGKYRDTEGRDAMSIENAMRVAETTQVTPAVLAEVIKKGMRVLVVGSPPGTFRERLTRHPFLMFWPSSEYNRRDGWRTIPSEVGAVLLTSILSHELSRNVREQVRARSLFCPMSPLSAGTISRMLNDTLSLLAESPLSAPEEPEMKTVAPFTPMPVEPQPDLVRLIDDTIAGLQLIRDGVVAMVAEQKATAEDRQKLHLLRDLLK